MKVLVIGSGGREHALCRAFKQSERVKKIFCAGGNAGIEEIAESVSIRAEDVKALADFAEEKRADLTFVGGETALALGVVDEFERRGLKIVGASAAAARLEASKAFAKDFMARHEIPTAAYAVADSPRKALEILQSGEFGGAEAPVVVKADGLAAGKGVVVAANRAEAEKAIRDLTEGELVSREASSTIVLEEFLQGREVSMLLFCDGESFSLMPPARDHKRIGEGDTGANTGGMGVITDAGLLTVQETEEIIEKIVLPTLDGARNEGFPFRGVLFVGLMMTAEGARVLEYNVRFGDPETQAILIRLETDLTEICAAILDRKLDGLTVEWSAGSSACVVLAAEGYPAKPRVGDRVSGLEAANSVAGAFVFQAGTARGEEGNIITTGGRVLGVTARGGNLEEAVNRAYEAAGKISFSGMQFRRDIGR